MSAQADSHGQSSELPLQARASYFILEEEEQKEETNCGQLATVLTLAHLHIFSYVQPIKPVAQNPLLVPEDRS